MDIQTRKIKFIQEFLKIENEETVSRFEELLKRGMLGELKKTLSPCLKWIKELIRLKTTLKTIGIKQLFSLAKYSW